MKKITKDLTSAVKKSDRGVSIGNIQKKLTKAQSGKIIESLRNILPYREAESYRPFNFWLPLIEQCALSNRHYNEEELFVRNVLPQIVEMLKLIKRKADDLHPECLVLYDDVLEILNRLSDEIGTTEKSDNAGVWFALKVSEGVSKTDFEVAITYLEGFHNDRFGEDKELKNKKKQLDTLFKSKKRTEPLEVKIPIQYKITTKHGKDIVWSGIGRIPADLKEELQRQGKTLEECKVN